ncbi:hypothetical protein [Streptomyces sp. NPDC006879]|uniref:hypothetical protein n=1 Tax=Streptomyces sp. NPDC006879 TaxID=3364767 RepID=UPI0036A84DA7
MEGTSTLAHCHRMERNFKFHTAMSRVRTLAAYRRPLRLTDEALLAGPVLDCPSGASSFGVEARGLGSDVTSADPAYRLPPRTLERVFDEARTGPGRNFLRDYARDWAGSSCHRRGYLPGSPGHLPFPDGRFVLTVSVSPLIGLRGPQDPVRALLEMTRVTAPTGQVRVALLSVPGCRGPVAVDFLRRELATKGVGSELLAHAPSSPDCAPGLLVLRPAPTAH